MHEGLLNLGRINLRQIRGQFSPLSIIFTVEEYETCQMVEVVDIEDSMRILRPREKGCPGARIAVTPQPFLSPEFLPVKRLPPGPAPSP